MDLSMLIQGFDILLFIIVLGTVLYLLVFAVAAMIGKPDKCTGDSLPGQAWKSKINATSIALT